jgi:thiosulfate reductase/polysulfide reductase chain A
MKALPGAVWVDENGTAYEKYAAALKSKLVLDADGSVWDKPADDPKRKQLAIVVGGVLFDKPEADGGVAVGRMIADQPWFTDGDKLLDGPKLEGKKPKQIGYAIGGTDPRRGFFTSSGKVEFHNAKFADKNDANGRPVDAGPVFRPRDWMPDTNFPLYLVNWKEASHTHTRSQNNPLLVAIKSSNPLIINSETAERIGIATGDEVIVESPNGSVRATAEVSARIHPEVVGLQHGFGHRALGRVAKGRGTAISDLNTMRYDPLAGQACHKEICVRVRKA